MAKHNSHADTMTAWCTPTGQLPLDVAARHRDAIEALRTFAACRLELAFAHLCTAALAGEEWAVERVSAALTLMTNLITENHAVLDHDVAAIRLRIIRATDTTRPDGAIARGIEI